MSLRTRNVKGSHGPCVCPFHACFRPVWLTIAPNDVRSAEIYSDMYRCVSKKGVFGDGHALIQHCYSAKTWHHYILAEYLNSVYADGAMILHGKPASKKKRKVTL